MARGKKTRRERWRLLRSKWLGAAAGLVLWAGGGTLSGRVLAQGPGADVPPAPEHSGIARYYLNKHMIQLPIQMDEKFRPILKEIRLYCKDQPSAPWTLRDTATATQTSFTFKAPHDGEYLFMMVTVDREGRCAPADVAKEEPSMTVVVDTQPPQSEVVLLGTVPEGQLIQCDIHDAHLDPSRTRVQYQTADRQFHDLDALPDRGNTYCIPGQANTTGQIRVSCADQAGNLGMRECNLSQLPKTTAAATVPKPTSTAATPEPKATAAAPSPMPMPTPPATEPKTVAAAAPSPMPTPAPAPATTEPKTAAAAPSPMPTPAPATTEQKLTGPQLPLPGSAEAPAKATPVALPPASAAPNHIPSALAASPALGTGTENRVPQGPPLGAPKAPTTPAAEAPIQKVAGTDVAVLPTAPSPKTAPATIAAKHTGMPVHHLLVNSPRVFLEYRIEQTGASGVGKVEVWCTRDKGQSWQKISEDRDRQSPAEVNLAGDGVYGLTLVVSNGLGFGAQPPAPGDAPDWWIEVDSTPPSRGDYDGAAVERRRPGGTHRLDEQGPQPRHRPGRSLVRGQPPGAVGGDCQGPQGRWAVSLGTARGHRRAGVLPPDGARPRRQYDDD